ncbi:MAG TPA: HAMP domain-containing sensor histidine kinase, partial [Phycisphaerae bacterium]|nr:HAMP domain-containing sensor histidine kinase [Phycisphaerae bacterium]
GLRGLQPVDYVETLECIKREAERAGQIVKNLLRFTREEQTSKSPSDVNDMVQHVAGLIQSYLPVENFKLDLDLSSALPPVAMNTTEIEQVVVNLIKNAVEAGGGAVRVAIRTAAGNGQVTLSVADTGPGIPPEHQLHIFDPFFTTKRTSGGTGLGLSLCHTIVTEHGGRIYLQSEVGRGSTFTIEFPAAVLQSAEKSGDGAATAESGVPRSESDYVCQKSC